MKAQATRTGGRWAQDGEERVIEALEAQESPIEITSPASAPVWECLSDRSKCEIALFEMMLQRSRAQSAGEMR